MRFVVRLGVIIFLLAVVLALVARPSDMTAPPLDLRHPSTVLPRAASGLRTIEARIRGWMDAGRAGYQARVPDVDPAPAPPQ